MIFKKCIILIISNLKKKQNDRVLWFNGESIEWPIRFEMVGQLLGLAIFN